MVGIFSDLQMVVVGCCKISWSCCLRVVSHGSVSGCVSVSVWFSSWWGGEVGVSLRGCSSGCVLVMLVWCCCLSVFCFSSSSFSTAVGFACFFSTVVFFCNSIFSFIFL